jgi:hypothetical protein
VGFRALAINMAGEADVGEEVDFDGREFRSGAITLICRGWAWAGTE